MARAISSASAIWLSSRPGGRLTSMLWDGRPQPRDSNSPQAATRAPGGLLGLVADGLGIVAHSTLPPRDVNSS
jgi:hypothetical protein